MRTATREEESAYKEFLMQSEYGVVATSSFFGRPVAATVTYISDESGNVYFFTRSTSRKAVNLARNRKVSFVVGFGPKSSTIQIDGAVTRVTGDEAGAMMAKFLSEREGFYMTFLKLEGYDFVCYKITPKYIQWLNIAPGVRKEDPVLIPIK